MTNSSNPQDDPPILRENLVNLMYEIAVNPLAYDSLLSIWDATLKRSVNPLDEQPSGSEKFLSHARRADEILSKLEHSQRAGSPSSIKSAIASDPRSIIVLSTTGDVLFANASFEAAFGDHDPKRISAWLNNASYGDEWAKLQARVSANDASDHTRLGVLQVQNRNGEDRSLFLLKRAQCPTNAKVGGVLCALSPVWDETASKALQHHFSLTESEIDIAKLIVGGAGVPEIAHIRGTSTQTVRTQIKSLLAKAGFNSKIDLVRHFGSLRDARWGASEVQDIAEGADLKQTIRGQDTLQSFQCASGLKIEYALIGPEDGDAVLFLHGMIDSLMMSSAIRFQLQERGLRLIAPVRPHFGGSDGYRPDMKPCLDFADIVVELLDDLEIGTVPVIGHMAGALYAYHLADKYPDRISAIVGVAGAVPMTKRWQFEGMSTGHRIAGLTARRFPLMLPLLIRGGTQLLRAGKEDFMLKLMFRDAPNDASLAASGEMRDIMFDRFQFVTEQGYKAFEIEVRQVSANWSDLAKRLCHPIGLIHGQHDRVVLIDGVKAFASLTGAKLTVSETSGQLVLNDRPKLVFDMLKVLSQDTRIIED